MATCSIAALLADAHANKFDDLSQNPRLAGAVTLQLVSQITGNELTVGELISQACDNKFACVGPTMGMSILLQQVCNQFGIEPVIPVECTNLIPEGSIYNIGGNQFWAGEFLEPGQTYTIIFGDNELSLVNFGGDPGGINDPVIGQEYTFTVDGATTAGVFLYSNSQSNLAVTATICAT